MPGGLPGRHYRHLPRYRQVVQVLARHGFGYLLNQLGLDRRLDLPWRRQPEAFPRPTPTLAEHFRLALEELGPTFIKLGQILSTRPDLLPPAFIAELTRLQDRVPPFPGEAARAMIEEELDQPLDALFVAFDPEPVAAASLGQVHYALLPSGEAVAVKVQRPDIETIIDTDLDILADLARLAQERTPLGENADLVEMAEDFAFILKAELDYCREGRNADRFRRNFAGESYLYIPKIYWDYTTRRVLTLERIAGIRIDDVEALDAAGMDRHRIALHSARIIIKEVLEDGFFHADPHPGNFFVMPGEVIGAMDFGMVGHLTPRDREDLLRLFIVAVRLDTGAIVQQLRRMGAVGPDVDQGRLERDIGRLLAHYHGLPLKEIRARQVLEDVTPITFRHRLRLRPQLWLLAKTLAMTEGVGLRLDPEFDIFGASQPYVRRFVREMGSPYVWLERLGEGAGEWTDLLLTLPGWVSRMLDRLEEAQFPVTRPRAEDDRLLTTLERAGNRLAMSLILAAFIVGLALLAPAALTGPWRDLIALLFVVGFLAVGLLAVALLVSLWRSGRR